MNIKEYLSVRRAYNKVRQETPAKTRITFEELAILVHLDYQDGPVCTSDIAAYQNVLRPTMTHRTNHLDSLGYIVRSEGELDRRNVCCVVSDEGRVAMGELLQQLCDHIALGEPLCRADASRMARYVDAMGVVFATAGQYVLVAIDQSPDKVLTISGLLGELGLLQPTVSMSVSTLEEEGLVQRERVVDGDSRRMLVKLTSEGLTQAHELEDVILDLVVRRPRGAKE